MDEGNGLCQEGYSFLELTLNPLSTSGLLTLYLIGSYHEMFICLGTYEKPLKRHHKLDHI